MLKAIAVLLLCCGINAELPACSSTSTGTECDSTYGGGTFPLKAIWHDAENYEYNHAVAWSPDGRYLARPHSKDYVTYIGIYEFVNERLWLIASHTAYDYYIDGLQFSADGKYLAYLYDSEYVVVLELRTVDSGRAMQISVNAIFDPKLRIQGFNFSPDGKHIAVARPSHSNAHGDHTHLSVLRHDPAAEFAEDRLTEISHEEFHFSVANTDVECVAWSKDGNYIAAGTDQGDVVVYQWDLTENQIKPGVFASYDVGGTLYSIDFSHDGKMLVVTESGNDEVYLLSFTTMGSMGSIGLLSKNDDAPLGGNGPARFSPDDTMVAVGRRFLEVMTVPSLTIVARKNLHPQVYLASGSGVASHATNKPYVNAFAWDPSGKYIAAVDDYHDAVLKIPGAPPPLPPPFPPPFPPGTSTVGSSSHHSHHGCRCSSYSGVSTGTSIICVKDMVCYYHSGRQCPSDFSLC